MANRLIWAAGWLLNHLPARLARYLPRPVVAAAYRQLLRRHLEGL